MYTLLYPKNKLKYRNNKIVVNINGFISRFGRRFNKLWKEKKN